MARFQQGQQGQQGAGLEGGSAPTGTDGAGRGGQGHMPGHGGQASGQGHGPQGLGDVFGFTISGGAVTAASVTLPSGTTVALPSGTGVTYALDGADVLATRTGARGTETLRFSDTDADGLYEVVSSARVLTEAPQVNGLGFTLRETLQVTLDATGSTVTGVTQARWDGTERVLLSATVTPDHTAWTLDHGLLVETHTGLDGRVHWEVFRDGNADGSYTEVASGTGALVDLVGVIAQTDAIASSL